MTIKVILGLPYLSNGPLLAKAKELQAPVLVSANCFSRWADEGFRYQQVEGGRSLKEKRWDGWNLSTLPNAHGLPEVHLDSAGFVAAVAYGGLPWTPQDYIFGLCAKYPWTRFSSLDLCVEQEIAGNRFEVEERIAKTIQLNRQCAMLAADAGIEDRLMPVIQGDTVDDYLRCFDALEGTIGDDRIIGVGSMCRRKVGGPTGIVSIVDALDRRLPKGITLHLFGLKSDGAECVADLDNRVASIDSQAYGFRARMIANERKKDDPTFSKSNAFVAEVMAGWYQKQVARMADPKPKPVQNLFDFPEAHPADSTCPWLSLEARARAEINELIEMGELDYDQAVTHHMVQAWMADMAEEAEDNLPLAA